MSPQFLTLPNAAPDTADVLILPVPHERTVTYKHGTGAGPTAILAASAELEFYEEDMGWCPTEHLKICVLNEVVSNPGEEATGFHSRLFKRVRALNSEALLIALGGEHSITPEMVFARMPEGGTVVQVDAHADLRAELYGSIYNHACPMYRLRQRGYRLVQIGIRSLHAREARLIEADEDISVYFDRALRDPLQWQRMLEHLSALSGPLWLTVDMDGFDPAVMPGVGTPQPGGLGWHQGLDILETLATNRAADIRGVDIVELVPEPSKVSDMMGAKLVQKIMSYWGMAQGFHRRPAHGSQIGEEDE